MAMIELFGSDLSPSRYIIRVAWQWLLSNLSYESTSVGNKIVDHSDVVGASPVGAAPKRKPPCIGGMKLVSLSCNRIFISAESYGLGWCKIAIATKWYQFHTTDKCGILFMSWITDQYTFVRYTKLVNKIGTAVEKVITFSIMTT